MTYPTWSLWCDLVYLLRDWAKTQTPIYVCPPDLKAAHDLYMEKRQVQLERERQQQHMEWEAERLERDAGKREEMEKEKDEYIRKKAAFLNLCTDGRTNHRQSAAERGRILRGRESHAPLRLYQRLLQTKELPDTIRTDRRKTHRNSGGGTCRHLRWCRAVAYATPTPNTTTASSNCGETMPNRYANG